MDSGGWGTTLALVLLGDGHEITLWSYREEGPIILQEKQKSPMLKGVSLPDGLALVSDQECIKNCKVVMLATPSFTVRTTARAVASLLEPSAVLVSMSKGIEKDISLTLTDAIAQEVGKRHPIVALSGPSHTEEVGHGIPTVVVSASRDKAAAELVQDLFMNERFRVRVFGGVVGAELGATLKSVIAFCAGICDSTGLGDNTRATLMARGLAEIAHLGVALGGYRETFAGLSGVGNPVVTCTSMHSRDRRCGILIGQGTPTAEAVKEVGAVVEDYYAAATACALAQKTGVEVPITEATYRVLYGERGTRAVIEGLMIRARKHELRDGWV